MRTVTRIVAIVAAFVLASTNILTATAAASPLGVVTQASRVNLASAPVSVGSVVFDGDSFNTLTQGLLQVRLGAARVHLSPESRLKLSGTANDVVAQLSGGAVVFSAVKAAAIDIEVVSAHIHPATDVPTIAKIALVGVREISVSAQQGAVQFSYAGETQLVPEGFTYRFTLDATEESQPSAQSQQKTGQRPPKPAIGVSHKFFYVVLAAAAATTYFVLDEDYESPSKP